MEEFPPALEAFVSLVDAQPGPVREAFQYYFCLLMVEAGKMKTIDVQQGEGPAVHTFEMEGGDRYRVTRPRMEEEKEAKLIEVLRTFLTSEGII